MPLPSTKSSVIVVHSRVGPIRRTECPVADQGLSERKSVRHTCGINMVMTSICDIQVQALKLDRGQWMPAHRLAAADTAAFQQESPSSPRSWDFD